MPVLVFAEHREKLQAWLDPTLLPILCPDYLLARILLACLLACSLAGVAVPHPAPRVPPGRPEPADETTCLMWVQLMDAPDIEHCEIRDARAVSQDGWRVVPRSQDSQIIVDKRTSHKNQMTFKASLLIPQRTAPVALFSPRSKAAT